MKTFDSHGHPPGAHATAVRSTESSPCRQIEADLSAMIDGELEAASVRRVMVHSDICPSCRGFLDSIRMQMRLHRDLAKKISFEASRLGQTECHDVVSDLGERDSVRVEALRQELLRNRNQLARILYELGRGYVLMGVSPNFSRVVAREPVPIPDMYMRGQSFLDEVSRSAVSASGVDWVRAKELFSGGELRSPEENMKKGKRLLCESLFLRPSFHEARIYLGHAYHVSEERDLARREFRVVLGATTDVCIRAFALENLGNVYLEEGHPGESISYFLQLVESGVIAREPRFFTAYFNLALAYGLLREFGHCRTWLSRLYEEFPHKRRLISEELVKRDQFVSTVKLHAHVEQDFAAVFPAWFPVSTEAC